MGEDFREWDAAPRERLPTMSCRQRRNACAIGSPRLGWLGLALTLLLLPVQALAQANQPPVADAGPDATMLIGESILLQGSGSDPDGDPIVSWLWTVEFAPAGSIRDLVLPTQPK